ncbi:MAG: tetratricopeptide repeat protein [Promethearchaeota archaeon]
MVKKSFKNFMKIFLQKKKSKFLKEIIEAQQYFKEEKFDSALNSLNSLTQEQIKELPIKSQLIYYYLKGKILMIKENYQEALVSAEKSYQIASKIENSVDKINSYLLFTELLQKTGNLEKGLEILEDIEKLIENLPKEDHTVKMELLGQYLRIKAWIYYNFGKIPELISITNELITIYEELGDKLRLGGAYVLSSSPYSFLGEYDKALDLLKRTDEIFSKIKVPYQFIDWEISVFIIYGMIYLLKGELIKAEENIKHAVKLAKENNRKMVYYMALNNLGCNYIYLADWDNAVKSFEECLIIAEKMGNQVEIANLLEGLFRSYLNKGDLKSAEECLDRIEQINLKENNKMINLDYRFTKALFLRKSSRTRDLGEAQRILKEISEEDVFTVELTIRAMVNLCEMLILEFKTSKDPEILNELTLLIDRLFKIAENQGSYWVMADTLLLKSKLALLTLDIDSARKSLNQGQIIAEKYGLKNLTIKISNENDELISNLATWEKIRSDNAPIEERLDKIKIDKQINSMLHKNGFEEPKTHEENPVLIMILTDSGLPLYTKTFDEQWKVNEQLFSGFLSAFNSFSDEIFSKGFDRAVFGDYSILMKHISPFMVCYIFLGQSYLAKKRFSKFIDNVQKTQSTIDKLNHSMKTGIVLKSSDMTNLENLFNQLFIMKKL